MGQWIRVHDQLPPIGEWVLMHGYVPEGETLRSKVPAVGFRNRDDAFGRYAWCDGEGWCSAPTHWMPLPEAPAEGG